MSKPAPAPTARNLLLLFIIIIPVLACKVFTPSAPTPVPEAIDGIHVNYPTGIETYRLDNGMIAVADIKGYYCLAFPVQWEVGAFHEDFIPTVDKYAQIHNGIKLLFDAIYGKDNSLRIFAIDTSSGHLSENNMTVLHIGMFQEEWRLESSLDDLTAEYMAYINSSGQLKVTNTFLGKSNYDIPYVMLLTKPVSFSGSGSPAYGAVALIKTDYAYLEILYTTLDNSIDIATEVHTILISFTTCAAQGDK